MGHPERDAAVKAARPLAIPCDYCCGRGKVPVVSDFVTEFYHETYCPRCSGDGQYVRWTCEPCHESRLGGPGAPFCRTCREPMQPSKPTEGNPQ